MKRNDSPRHGCVIVYAKIYRTIGVKFQKQKKIK